MFADFLGVCFDQIVNSIAKHRFMSGGRISVPLVIRASGGGGVQFGAQHSQTAESWFLPFPGLKIVAPATPADAYDLLRAAIQDDNPVLVLEHKGLLGVTGPVDIEEDRTFAISGPALVRSGRDVTIVASLAMLPRALEAADILAKEGVEVEVINLRTLRPLDCGPIAESVRRTNRLITVEEQHDLGGWGAQVGAQVTSLAFDYLDAPPHRITLEDYPLPFSKPLEDAARPTSQRISDVVRAIL
jgi:pyruvate dehydrogenase E1 component beta subunit